jgi:alanine racemase
MGRNGALPKDALHICRAIAQMQSLECTGIFSHFACSYSEQPEDQQFTRQQIAVFTELLEPSSTGRGYPAPVAAHRQQFGVGSV